jgi:hypothetical protein
VRCTSPGNERLMTKGILGLISVERIPPTLYQAAFHRKTKRLQGSRKLVWMVVFSSSSFTLISHNHTSQKQISNLKSSHYTVTSSPCSMMVTFKTAFSYLFRKRIKTLLVYQYIPAW